MKSLVPLDEMIRDIRKEIEAETGQDLFINMDHPGKTQPYTYEMRNEADLRDMSDIHEEFVNSFVNSAECDRCLNYHKSLRFTDTDFRLGSQSSQLSFRTVELIEYEFMKFDCYWEYTKLDNVNNDTIYRDFFDKLKTKCHEIYWDFERRIGEIYPSVKVSDHVKFESMFSTIQNNLYQIHPPNFYIGATSTCSQKVALSDLSVRELDLFMLYGIHMLKSEHVNRLIRPNVELNEKFQHLFQPLHLQEVFDLKHDSIRAALDACLNLKPTNDLTGTNQHYQLYKFIVLIKKPVLDLSLFKMSALQNASEEVKNLKWIQTADFHLYPNFSVNNDLRKFDDCKEDFYKSCAQFNYSQHFRPKRLRKNLQLENLSKNLFKLHDLNKMSKI
jgi:hypothetical protein